MMTPSTPSELTPSMNSTPMFMSVMAWVRPKGTTMKPQNAVITTQTGANQKTILSAPDGIRSSLMISFRASAMGCSSPCGPTRMGPMRTCMWAITLRSNQFMKMTPIEMPRKTSST